MGAVGAIAGVAGKALGGGALKSIGGNLLGNVLGKKGKDKQAEEAPPNPMKLLAKLLDVVKGGAQ